MNAVDVAAVSILGIAVLRGLFIGVIKEVFSLTALAGACIAVRFGATPVAEWLTQNAPLELDPLAALVAAGAAVGIGTALAIGVCGRLLRRGARLAGLGVADRLAGGALGAAEGALVVAVLLVLAFTIAGRDWPLLAESRSLEAFEQAEELARTQRGELPAVGAPPRP